jgi:putative oxidoreductase
VDPALHNSDSKQKEITMELAAHPPRSFLRTIAGWYGAAVRAITTLTPVLDLAIRIWVADAFFKSGLTKIMSWDTTIALFENEYAVPLLPPEIAAYLGTATELGIPVLLVLGLFTRPAALFLFVFNIIAVISYPDLSEGGLKDHIYWGLLLLVTFFHGPGKLSVDHLIRSKLAA